MCTKTFNLVIVIFIALLFSLIAFNNISDYNTNFQFVKSVLSMESVKTKNVMWRAVTSPSLEHSVYIAIIIWEVTTAVVCWIGAFRILWTKLSVGRSLATVGLMMGAALFMIGFVIIAGEWFYIWDSDLEPMQSKAMLLSLLLVTFAYYMHGFKDLTNECLH